MLRKYHKGNLVKETLYNNTSDFEIDNDVENPVDHEGSRNSNQVYAPITSAAKSRIVLLKIIIYFNIKYLNYYN